jgi:hypothetical protein
MLSSKIRARRKTNINAGCAFVAALFGVAVVLADRARAESHEQAPLSAVPSGSAGQAAIFAAKLPALDNTIDVKSATFKSTIGVPAIVAALPDPGSYPTFGAIYSMCFFEILTSRLNIDKKFFGTPLRSGSSIDH